MIYDIRLVIRYDYDRPASEGRHHLRLLPADVPGVQRVQAARLTVQPQPAERTDFTDFFGNSVISVRLAGGHAFAAFEAVATVERLMPAMAPDTSRPLASLGDAVRAERSLGPGSPHHFRAPSPRIAAVDAITDHARLAVAGVQTARAAVQALGLSLHRDMAFDARATTVDTPPDAAFAQRRGVCQDFAQVMIAGLRGIGVPAGYVSGFLRTVPPPGKPRLEGADAMHAWVRAWCGPGVGWVEYDPTNACFAGDSHVTIAHGRDYGDVSPVAGVLRIAGRQKSTQAVDVVARG